MEMENAGVYVIPENKDLIQRKWNELGDNV